jgi:hypothetical protein
MVSLYECLNLGSDDQIKVQLHQEDIKNHTNVLSQNNFKKSFEQIYQDQSFGNRSFVQAY